MNTKHTPGPWTFDGKTVYAKNQPNVCRIENGHLIAAAPELLNMLRRVVDEYLTQDPANGPISPLTLEQARAVIAKAEGSS